jgi:acyl-CoA synthetase (AMP-forming)/AMP-acid ligase II
MPRSLEAALQRHAAALAKAPACTVLDLNCKPVFTLTYAKLLSRARRVAYNLIEKVSCGTGFPGS